MDRQVSKINKSDGRDSFFKAFCEGKEACRKSRTLWHVEGNPYDKGTICHKEWNFGWSEQRERIMTWLTRLSKTFGDSKE